MDSKHTISISEARKRIFEIANEVQKPDTHYMLTENGKPKAVILSAEEFENLLDDLDILSDPDLLKDIETNERAIAEGDYITWEDLKKELHEVDAPMLVREKATRKYGIKKVQKKH
jgi:antitoxin YefM